jgi:hypothetical protein
MMVMAIAEVVTVVHRAGNDSDKNWAHLSGA